MKTGTGFGHAAFFGVKTYERTEMATQVDKIRADIQRCGESYVGGDELRLLCGDIPEREEIKGITQIAAWEGWDFEYLADFSVRFTPSQPAAAVLGDC